MRGAPSRKVDIPGIVHFNETSQSKMIDIGPKPPLDRLRTSSIPWTLVTHTASTEVFLAPLSFVNNRARSLDARNSATTSTLALHTHRVPTAGRFARCAARLRPHLERHHAYPSPEQADQDSCLPMVGFDSSRAFLEPSVSWQLSGLSLSRCRIKTARGTVV